MRNAHANVHLAGDFEKEEIPGSVTKLTARNLLIYVKPIPEFFTSEHTPLVCWRGSGYTFEGVRRQNIGKHEVYLGRLKNGESQLFTAWWYDNGEVTTVSQASWRGRMLAGQPPFCLVNIRPKVSGYLLTNCIKYFTNNFLLSMRNDYKTVRRRIRILLIIFIAGLSASGITAFPLETELQYAGEILAAADAQSDIYRWIKQVHDGVRETNSRYPFIAYGTDWLAFAHFIIAIAFFGALRDPVKNRWVVQFGIIACIAVFPFAFIAGEVRGIPIYWRLIDCLFGVAGGIILLRCHHNIRELEKLNSER